MISVESKGWSVVYVSVFLSSLVGCGQAATGGGGQAQALMVFPKQDALASIAAAPAPKVELPRTAPALDELGPVTTPEVSASLDAWQPTSDWDRLFAKVVDASAVKPQLTAPMACAARAIGEFYLDHNAPPDMSAERFMVAVCGNVVPELRFGYVTLDVPAKVPDDELYKNGSPKFEPLLGQYVPPDSTHAGFWFGRRANQVVSVIVSAKEAATLKPGPIAPNEQGDVVFEGHVNQASQSFMGYINQGSGKSVACAVDMSVQRPAFRIVCPMDPQDESAWVQLLAMPPQRALGSVFLQAMVKRTPEVQPRYVVTKYGPPAVVKTPEEFTTVVLDSLSRARKAAGLGPVKMARAESATAAKVAPHYFASVFGKEETRNADVIALGLLAGWDVQGMIRNAHFVSTTATTLDANRWLAMALEMPMGRHTLFAPELDEVALGPAIMTEQGITGALAIGYRFHRNADHSEDEKFLLTRVQQARQTMALAAPQRILNYAPILREELAKLNANQATPQEAMQRILDRSVASTNMSTRLLMIQTASLEELVLPDQILRKPSLRMDIGVTHFKAPGAAWAQYAIVVVFVDEAAGGGEAVASLERR